MKTVLIILGVVIVILVIFALVRSRGTYNPAPKVTNSPAPKISNSISIENFSFNPSNIDVTIGTTVTWINNDSTAHTVTSDNGMFASKNIQPGGTFGQAFSASGVYSYHCSIHPNMKGTVTVK